MICPHCSKTITFKPPRKKANHKLRVGPVEGWPVEAMALHKHEYRLLEATGIKTIGQFDQMTDTELLHTPNWGARRLRYYRRAAKAAHKAAKGKS